MSSFRGFEVECTDTYAFYEAEVVDSAKKKKNQNDKLLINWLPADWKPQEWVDVSRVRSRPKPPPASWRPRVGEKLEVLNRAAENEPDAWWPAKVKAIAGSQYVIGYSGWDDDQYDSHVDLQDLRPLNTCPRLRGVDVAKYRREIPEGKKVDDRTLRDHDRALSILDSREVDVAKLVDECHAYTYIDLTERTFKDPRSPRGRHYLIIGPKKSARKAVTVLKLDVDHAIKKQILNEAKDRIEGIQKKREEREAKYLAMCHDQFLVPEECVRYVIGREGSNIAEARKIVEGPRDDSGGFAWPDEEIGKIDLQSMAKGTSKSKTDMATVDIYAYTLQRVEMARELLEISNLEKRIPSEFLGTIIGSKGSNINQIKESSGVLAINIPNKPDKGPRDEFIDITIVGKPVAIQDCEGTIDRIINQEEELQALRKEVDDSREAFNQWNKRSNLSEMDDSLADMSLAERSTPSPQPVLLAEETPISPSPSPDPVATSESSGTKKKKRRRRKGRKA